MTIETRSSRPLPWAQVGLALVPGLFVLAWLASRSVDPVAEAGYLAGLCAVLCVAALIRHRHVPAWGLAPLGILASAALLLSTGLFAASDTGSLLWPVLGWAVVAALLADRDAPRRAWVCLGLLLLTVVANLAVSAASDPGQWRAVVLASAGPELWWTALLLLPVALGLPLARRHGLAAGLFVVAAVFLPVAGLWDPAYGVAVGAAGPSIGLALGVCPAVCLLIATPAWLLRSPSSRAQSTALLVPAMAGLLSALALYIAACWHAGHRPALAMGMAVVQVGLVLALMAATYAGLERGGKRPMG